MKYEFLLALALSLSACAQVQSADSNTPAGAAETRCFELRTYYAAPGKLDALNARFRDHTIQIFNQHGMESIGYWMPVDNSANKLVYLLAFPSREAASNSWKAFFADPEWRKVAKESEANGRLVTKVDSVFLSPTDYSLAVKPSRSDPPRLFELRTYTAAPVKLGDLNTRFRDKTMALFTKHGITSIGYWVPMDKDKGADNTLIYIVAHKDHESADNSWKAFGQDFEWIAAKKFSEYNGPLTVTNGVKRVFMNPTDYSPMK
jgi:hypothetical protein